MPIADKVRARVQQSFLACRFVYREPVFDLDKLEEDGAQAAFAAFRPWNISLENVTFKEEPKNAAEFTTNFSLLGGRIIFTIGPAGCELGANNPNWADTELIVALGKAGSQAVIKAVGASLEKQLATITVHLTPEVGTASSVTEKFVRLDKAKLPDGVALASGFSVYGQNVSWVVDKSVPYVNSLFVRIDRTFSSDVPLEQIASQLNDDEARILEILGLEVD